jgi:hypothetical protein
MILKSRPLVRSRKIVPVARDNVVREMIFEKK